MSTITPNFRMLTLLASGILAFTGPAQAVTAQFHGLGAPPPAGQSSQAVGISADGSVVVGSTYFSGTAQAFRWTAQTGLVGLGDLPGGAFTSTAAAVSSDGLVVVGDSCSTRPKEATRWSSATGLVGLGALPSHNYSSATDVSADGRVIVGMSSEDNGNTRAFRWTAENGMVALAGQPGDAPYAYAGAVSADGRYIVGHGYMGDAFRWTAETGMVRLNTAPLQASHAQAVSNDGNVIAGFGYISQDVARPYKWTSEGGTVLLDMPSGYTNGSINDVSADGSIMLGRVWVDFPTRVVLWDGVHGPRFLEDVLEQDHGLDLNGWSFQYATMSADGTAFAGGGVNPQGQYQAWRAVVPEPSTALLLLGALVSLLVKSGRPTRRST